MSNRKTSNSSAWLGQQLDARRADHPQSRGPNTATMPWCLVLDLKDRAWGFDVGEVMTQGRWGFMPILCSPGTRSRPRRCALCSIRIRTALFFLLLPDAKLPRVNIENAPNVMTFLPVQDGGTTEERRRSCCKSRRCSAIGCAMTAETRSVCCRARSKTLRAAWVRRWCWQCRMKLASKKCALR